MRLMFPPKIFFRYLFIRLLVPFTICLCACTMIWVMADLYGNLDDFLGHKINLGKVLYFYILQIPNMLVQVLPAALLFSALWTLLALNRRCELVAFQSGGMTPLWLFSPFFAFALILTIVMAFDLNWPAAKAQVKRDHLLAEVKGGDSHSNVFKNLPWVDKIYRRVWFFANLDTNSGTAKGVELLQRDADGHDIVKYFAREGKYTDGGFWRLSGVLKITYNISGGVQEQKTYEELDLPDITTPPKQLSLIASPPDELTLSQLSQYIATSTSTQGHVAAYRTEWWYRILYPSSLVILMLFALVQGTRTDRRSPVVGISLTVGVLLAYIILINFSMTLGKHDRLPAFVSVIIVPALFALVGLYLLAVENGWWWQLTELGKRLLVQDGDEKDGAE